MRRLHREAPAAAAAAEAQEEQEEEEQEGQARGRLLGEQTGSRSAACKGVKLSLILPSVIKVLVYDYELHCYSDN